MIDLLRRLTLLMLVLALPFNGMAGIDSSVEPCPMQAAGMNRMAGMQHDCCQDQDQGQSSHHGSKACKVGQECSTASVLQVNLAEPAMPFAAPGLADSYARNLLTRAAPDLWRPPRA
ncbi:MULTISPECIES: hypothetical protein [Pseudomonas]|uniref:hypothetical protein n=1 Tax=Pseudomonas TaxID=286 RepID=UPI00235DC6C8|nr:hypothetical protein [Pseudomonas asplenii]